MNPNVPSGAAMLLDFIAKPESRGLYTKIYDNHEAELATPITSLTLNALITAQAEWGRRWSSSAAGRYQFMPDTLAGLKPVLGLTGAEVFAPDLQDRLGYALLQRRGYAAFVARTLSMQAFGKALAEEWASLPVLAPTQGAHRMLARGQSYYESDGLNHARVTPEAVEAVLRKVLVATAVVQPAPRPPTHAVAAQELRDAGSRTIAATDLQTKLGVAAGGLTVLGTIVDQVNHILDAVPWWGWLGLAVAGLAGVVALGKRIEWFRADDALTGAHIGRDIGLSPAAPAADPPEPEADLADEPQPALAEPAPDATSDALQAALASARAAGV